MWDTILSTLHIFVQLVTTILRDRKNNIILILQMMELSPVEIMWHFQDRTDNS